MLLLVLHSHLNRPQSPLNYTYSVALYEFKFHTTRESREQQDISKIVHGGRELRPGVYAATLTFFDIKTHELDIDTLKKHIVRLADAGLSGIITLGSNGEAAHLSAAEKKLVTKATAEALQSSGHGELIIIVGSCAHSVE